MCPHREQPRLGYMEFVEDGHERTKRGERQRQCSVCGLWIWQSFWGPADWPTNAANGGQCVIFLNERKP